MTIQGAIADLNNLLNADDVPFYYEGSIKKVIETIEMEFEDVVPLSAIEDIKAEIKAKASEHVKYADCGRKEDGLYEALDIIDRKVNEAKGEATDKAPNEVKPFIDKDIIFI